MENRDEIGREVLMKRVETERGEACPDQDCFREKGLAHSADGAVRRTATAARGF